MIVQHLGSLHPIEQGLTIALAFGPFVVLGIVIAVRRRADVRAEQREASPDASPDDARSPGEG